jgi:plastocyanin
MDARTGSAGCSDDRTIYVEEQDMKRIAAILGFSVLLMLPAAAMANIAAPGAAPATSVQYAQETGVTIVDFAFSPAFVTIPAGSTVTWYNSGAAPHTATSNSGAFASEVLGAGGAYTATLWTPGAYGYFCEIHPGMVGTVEVF